MAGREQIERDVIHILAHFPGREYSGTIDGSTRFFADLGLLSIHAVRLAELLERHYGRQFEFHRFLSELGQRQVEDIEVNDLVEFLQREMQIG
jgi:acyl carrier protein